MTSVFEMLKRRPRWTCFGVKKKAHLYLALKVLSLRDFSISFNILILKLTYCRSLDEQDRSIGMGLHSFLLSLIGRSDNKTVATKRKSICLSYLIHIFKWIILCFLKTLRLNWLDFTYSVSTSAYCLWKVVWQHVFNVENCVRIQRSVSTVWHWKHASDLKECGRIASGYFLSHYNSSIHYFTERSGRDGKGKRVRCWGCRIRKRNASDNSHVFNERKIKPCRLYFYFYVQWLFVIKCSKVHLNFKYFKYYK